MKQSDSLSRSPATAIQLERRADRRARRAKHRQQPAAVDAYDNRTDRTIYYEGDM